ncbi:MAG: HNH endonuclease [candidate division WS2 bacterium ADurb.Bin280]|uniref:HNH endonuclease n=1 Tax=candidate division WS2 bacterium ADurb.Bin280 TaxID=1852829 RepID=A0A1V5SEL5_9BACT|nr:MAG: HNH endonuclease [candidate division WS2 bacterium ADurb.Bin280]
MVAENSWLRCKRDRAMEVGWRCEVCGASQEEGAIIVGHHLIPKSRNGRDIVENCRLRCDLCEKAAHIFSQDGNPPEWKMEEYIATRTRAEQEGERMKSGENSQLCKDLARAWRRKPQKVPSAVALYA